MEVSKGASIGIIAVVAVVVIVVGYMMFLKPKGAVSGATRDAYMKKQQNQQPYSSAGSGSSAGYGTRLSGGASSGGAASGR